MDKVTEISIKIATYDTFKAILGTAGSSQTCKDKYFLKRCATHDNTDILNLIQHPVFYPSVWGF